MERGRRTRLIYSFVLPTIAAAAGILGYVSWRSASQFAALGEQSIVQSTVLLVDEKVDRVEQQIIDADNAVFHLVDLDHLESLEERWTPLAVRISPSVTSVLVVDDGGNVIAFASRGSERARRDFLKVFLERILADLELERWRIDQLRHLHRTYAARSYLISYKAIRYRGRRHYLIAHHDTSYFVRHVFPTLFVTEEGKRRYNIVDEDNRRIYGSSLARAGDYLVGRRFPTTLYNWRLQMAPKQAPLLTARRRSGFVTEIGLIGLSFGIILLGLVFLIYAAMKESRLNALRSEFVANVSHELKTPLSVVRMFTEMLLTKRVRSEEKERQYLEIIYRESGRLSALIENVLDFSALERGKQQFQMRIGDLVELAQHALDTFRFRVEREEIEVRLAPAPELPRIPFDEHAILLAILNLLDNAAKYGQGPVELILERGRRHVYVRVRDHGTGIPASEHRRVFERFYRVRRDTETRGSGIGLSLVERIAEAHGGRAWAENAPGGGALVSFSLPIRSASWQPRPDEPSESAPDQAAAAE